MVLPDNQTRLQLFQTLLDRSSEGVIFVDSENQIRCWNRAAELMFDVDSEAFPTDQSVRRCVLPGADELKRLQTGDLATASGIITVDRANDSPGKWARMVDVVEIDDRPWLMVRLRNDGWYGQSESELYQQAHTDHLSELLNRRGFQATLESNLHRRLALAIIDVDYFKRINDRHGHETGDQAIRWIADRLRERFPEAICIGRLGGDEFGVVLEVKHRDVIENQFTAFCAAVNADPISWNPDGISISIGVAISKSPGTSARDLLTQADRAMYQSKNGGRNGSTAVDI